MKKNTNKKNDVPNGDKIEVFNFDGTTNIEDENYRLFFLPKKFAVNIGLKFDCIIAVSFGYFEIGEPNLIYQKETKKLEAGIVECDLQRKSYFYRTGDGETVPLDTQKIQIAGITGYCPLTKVAVSHLEFCKLKKEHDVKKVSNNDNDWDENMMDSKVRAGQSAKPENDQSQNSQPLFANMSEIETVKKYIDDLIITTSNEQWVVDGLILLLNAINEKAAKSSVSGIDFSHDVITHLYTWTNDFSKAWQFYIEKAKTKTIADYD